MSPSLGVQAAIRARLIASPALIALVPADHIVGTVGLPRLFPCIMLGQDQEVAENLTLSRQHVRVHSNLHVWDRSGGLSTAKAISGAIRKAMPARLTLSDDLRCLEHAYAGSRFLTDPDGQTAHAIVEFESLVEAPR